MHLQYLEEPQGRPFGFQYAGDVYILAAGLGSQAFKPLVDLEGGGAAGDDGDDIDRGLCLRVDHVEKPLVFGNEVVYVDILVENVDISHVHEDLAWIQIVQAYLKIAFNLVDAHVTDAPVIDWFCDPEGLCQFSDRKRGERVGAK